MRKNADSERNTTDFGRTNMQSITDKEMKARLKVRQGELDAVLMDNAPADKARNQCVSDAIAIRTMMSGDER